MLELVAAEEKLIANPVWKERHERHLNSARKAVDDLCGRLDDIETEGDMTFEDGMITCSALQLGMYGLQTTEPSQQKKYSEAARYLMDKHKCLEQLLIPDCRMRGSHTAILGSSRRLLYSQSSHELSAWLDGMENLRLLLLVSADR